MKTELLKKVRSELKSSLRFVIELMDIPDNKDRGECKRIGVYVLNEITDKGITPIYVSSVFKEILTHRNNIILNEIYASIPVCVLVDRIRVFYHNAYGSHSFGKRIEREYRQIWAGKEELFERTIENLENFSSKQDVQYLKPYKNTK